MNDKFNKRPKGAANLKLGPREFLVPHKSYQLVLSGTILHHVADLVQTNANIVGGQMILVIQSHVFATEAGYNVSAAAVVGVNPV